ncbi:MAG: PepSY domain-containing protein [Caldicoprobacterales bacterium]
MHNKDIENKVKTAVQHSVPDILDSILSDCEGLEGEMLRMNTQTSKKSKNMSWIKPLATIAAVFVLLFVGLTSYLNMAIDSIISFDINPSIELMVNRKEKVIRVKALNEDGEKVIGNMNFKNTDLDIAVNALIGSMLTNGYIDDMQNSILISVENSNKDKSTSLQARLEGEVSRLLDASNVDGAVLSQSIVEDKDIEDLAKENMITKGKAQLVLQLVEKHEGYDFEELAKLSVNDLNLLVESKKLDIENSSKVGKASDRAYIGTDKAISIAVNHVGAKGSDIKDLEIELEYDDGRFIYEMEFYLDGIEYEFDIHAISGEILSFEKDRDDNYKDTVSKESPRPTSAPTNKPTEKPSPTSAPTSKATEKASPTPTTRPKASQKPVDPTKEAVEATASPKTDNLMSAAAARKAVMDRFGGIVQKIEYNYDSKNPLYKGEALKDGYEVDFELNARSKEFKKWDVENDDEWDEFAHALEKMITMDEAAAMVIARSGMSNTFIQKIEFDWDDEKPLYKGEAFNKDKKFSFEIHAYKGKGFYKWDVDNDDDTWEEKFYNIR